MDLHFATPYKIKLDQFQYFYAVVLQCDNRTEFVLKDVDLWAYSNGLTMDFSRPAKPEDNPYVESFYGKFRDNV